jgi:hypothetical protein
MRFKLTKLSNRDPNHPGHFEVGYWISGIADGRPKVGDQLSISNNIDTPFRNSEGFHWFHTSVVEHIEPTEINEHTFIITTKNSVWKLEEYP